MIPHRIWESLDFDGKTRWAIHMQARTYLPAYGKFAQVDPAYDQTKDDPESWNLYNYTTNNPVTKTDPDGRMVSNSDPYRNNRCLGSEDRGSTLGDYESEGDSQNLPGGGDGKSKEGKTPAPKTDEHGITWKDLFGVIGAQDPARASDKPGSPVSTQEPDDYKTTAKVPTPLPKHLDTFVRDFVRESGDNFPSGVTITATSNGTHSANSAHYKEQAVDVRYNAKDPKKALAAAARAGAQFGLDEKVHPSGKSSGPHFHFQLIPGRGGSKGDLPFRGTPGSPRPRESESGGVVSRLIDAAAFVLSTSLGF